MTCSVPKPLASLFPPKPGSCQGQLPEHWLIPEQDLTVSQLQLIVHYQDSEKLSGCSGKTTPGPFLGTWQGHTHHGPEEFNCHKPLQLRGFSCFQPSPHISSEVCASPPVLVPAARSRKSLVERPALEDSVRQWGTGRTAELRSLERRQGTAHKGSIKTPKVLMQH